MKKLGGWTRLWILFSVLWAILVFGYVSSTVPSKSEVRVSYDRQIEKVKASLNRLMYGEENPERDLNQIKKGQRVKKNYSDAELDTLSIVEMAYENLLFRTIGLEEQREYALDTYWNMVSKKFGMGFLLWFISILIIYLLGHSIGWIIQGFKKQAS